mmetsp:Transcript_6482/g.14162  ORF Transcript_6482/g.14162 Transcript_6482/m.14162 type:complete len:216 (-) Transcript_6482:660-1307(-)
MASTPLPRMRAEYSSKSSALSPAKRSRSKAAFFFDSAAFTSASFLFFWTILARALAVPFIHRPAEVSWFIRVEVSTAPVPRLICLAEAWSWAAFLASWVGTTRVVLTTSQTDVRIIKARVLPSASTSLARRIVCGSVVRSTEYGMVCCSLIRLNSSATFPGAICMAAMAAFPATLEESAGGNFKGWRHVFSKELTIASLLRRMNICHVLAITKLK